MVKLFGRRLEIEAVTRHLADDRAVVVTGEAGIGKTALLDAVAEASGRRVWRGGGLSMLAQVPYLALERAVGRRLEGDPASVVRAIADQVGDGVLFIDDLQWIDPFGLATVERLADRIALLGAVRLGERPSERVLASLKFAGSAVIELSPLDEETSGQLIADVRPGASALERDRIARLAGHNPLLMTELAQTGETESLRRAVRARLHPVSETGRDWLRAIAIVGRPVDRDKLGASADELEAAHLLVPTGSGRVEIRHDLLAEVVRGDMADDIRADTHRRVARLVDDSHEAARHHFLGGEHALAHAPL